jgi:hypothetical protein
MRFPIDSLLDIRRQVEDEATRTVAGAVTARDRAEAEQQRLVERAAAARARARSGDVGGASTIEAALHAERFRARLAEAAQQAEGEALTHRKGPLRAARTGEEAARAAQLTAHRDREAAERLAERGALIRRRAAERRAEEAASEAGARGRRDR